MKRSISSDDSKQAGIWIRVSTENQAKGDSPELHEKRARLYAESKGWPVVEVYHLEAVSGKSVMDHPETQRMLRDIRQGRVTALIFSKLARLARNTRELLDFSDIFRDCGADLVSLQESIDTSTPAGRLFYTMIAAMAQWEREEIADRVSVAMTARAKLGQPLNGKAPYGYVWKDKKLMPEPTEAPVRKLMYELFIEHRRKKTVARLLNERGLRTRDGSRWSDTSVGRLIADPTAKGWHRANYTKRMGANKPWVAKPEAEWVWSEVEPIVPEPLWEQCNQILTERKAKQKRPGKKPVHLFAGLTFCHCGRKMYVPTNTPKYVCQGCRNKIPIMDLETVYYEHLRDFFLSRKQILAHLGYADEHLKEKEELLASLELEAEKIEQEVQRVYRLYGEGGLTAQGFAKFHRPLEERQNQLNDEIPRLQAEVDILKVNGLSGDQILLEAKDLYGRWPKLTKAEKQSIVASITKKIVVEKDEIAITLSYLPSSEEMTKEQRCL